MKWSLALSFLGAVILATTLQRQWLGPEYEEDRAREVASVLADDTRFGDVRVQVRGLDAILEGEVDSPADREAAQALAGAVWGVRARAVDNRLQVRARLDAIVEADASSQTSLPLESVSIRGCLPENSRTEDLPAVFSGVSVQRRISSNEVVYHPFVGSLPRFDRAGLALLAAEFSRLPSIGMIELTARGIRLSGDAFPAQKQRLEEIAAGVVRPPARVESQLRAIDLTEPARQALAQVPGLENVQVKFNEAYASLSGTVATAELRTRAARIVENIRLARLREDQNQIALSALFAAVVRKDEAGHRSVHLSGLLPDESWKARLIAALGRLQPGWSIETGSLRFARSLHPAGWLEKERFFGFFEAFFALPAPGSIRIDANGLVTQGKMTPAWRERLRALTRDFGFSELQVRDDYELHPSVFHLPEYRRTSTLPAETNAAVEAALRETRIHFEIDRAEPSPAELEKLDRLAAVLRTAGDACALVVGAYIEPEAAPDVQERQSRARAEAVLRRLEARGWPRERCQVESFELVRSSAAALTEDERRASRCVEILLR